MQGFEADGPVKIFVAVEALKTSTSRILLQVGCLNSYRGTAIHIAFAPTDSLVQKGSAFLSKLHIRMNSSSKKELSSLVLKDGSCVPSYAHPDGLARLEDFISKEKLPVCLVFFSIFEHQTLAMLARGYKCGIWISEQDINFMEKIDQSVQSVFIFENFKQSEIPQNISKSLNEADDEYSALRGAFQLRRFIHQHKFSWKEIRTVRWTDKLKKKVKVEADNYLILSPFQTSTDKSYWFTEADALREEQERNVIVINDDDELSPSMMNNDDALEEDESKPESSRETQISDKFHYEKDQPTAPEKEIEQDCNGELITETYCIESQVSIEEIKHNENKESVTEINDIKASAKRTSEESNITEQSDGNIDITEGQVDDEKRVLEKEEKSEHGKKNLKVNPASAKDRSPDNHKDEVQEQQTPIENPKVAETGEANKANESHEPEIVDIEHNDDKSDVGSELVVEGVAETVFDPSTEGGNGDELLEIPVCKIKIGKNKLQFRLYDFTQPALARLCLLENKNTTHIRYNCVLPNHSADGIAKVQLDNAGRPCAWVTCTPNVPIQASSPRHRYTATEYLQGRTLFLTYEELVLDVKNTKEEDQNCEVFLVPYGCETTERTELGSYRYPIRIYKDRTGRDLPSTSLPAIFSMKTCVDGKEFGIGLNSWNFIVEPGTQDMASWLVINITDPSKFFHKISQSNGRLYLGTASRAGKTEKRFARFGKLSKALQLNKVTDITWPKYAGIAILRREMNVGLAYWKIYLFNFAQPLLVELKPLQNKTTHIKYHSVLPNHTADGTVKVFRTNSLDGESKALAWITLQPISKPSETKREQHCATEYLGQGAACIVYNELSLQESLDTSSEDEQCEVYLAADNSVPPGDQALAPGFYSYAIKIFKDDTRAEQPSLSYPAHFALNETSAKSLQDKGIILKSYNFTVNGRLEDASCPPRIVVCITHPDKFTTPELWQDGELFHIGAAVRVCHSVPQRDTWGHYSLRYSRRLENDGEVSFSLDTQEVKACFNKAKFEYQPPPVKVKSFGVTPKNPAKLKKSSNVTVKKAQEEASGKKALPVRHLVQSNSWYPVPAAYNCPPPSISTNKIPAAYNLPPPSVSTNKIPAVYNLPPPSVSTNKIPAVYNLPPPSTIRVPLHPPPPTWRPAVGDSSWDYPNTRTSGTTHSTYPPHHNYPSAAEDRIDRTTHRSQAYERIPRERNHTNQPSQFIGDGIRSLLSQELHSSSSAVDSSRERPDKRIHSRLESFEELDVPNEEFVLRKKGRWDPIEDLIEDGELYR